LLIAFKGMRLETPVIDSTRWILIFEELKLIFLAYKYLPEYLNIEYWISILKHSTEHFHSKAQTGCFLAAQVSAWKDYVPSSLRYPCDFWRVCYHFKLKLELSHECFCFLRSTFEDAASCVIFWDDAGDAVSFRVTPFSARFSSLISWSVRS
jgi:hypothetical protein